MRTKTTRATALAAIALAAALATTACESGNAAAERSASGTPQAGGSAASSASSAPDASGSGGPAGTGGDRATGTATPRPGSKGNGSAAGDRGAGSGGTADGADGARGPVVTCTGANNAVDVKRPARPINHLLLTTTNRGSVPCDLYGAPLLRFDEDQAATAVDDGTRGHSVIRLAPGESAYASVVMVGERTGSEVNGRTVARLGVLFAPRDGSGSTGPSVSLTLPPGTYKTDDVTVTHWLSDLDEALAH
ncbi:DUF4232 domain-containing protein [Streptomyces sp. NRRL S-118]|uniref:DUF4232 domain-containing protein n=1 Tax=Streptomyces sp. NRRL S-118 TaxID=1463881 RepID=UPI0006950A39|nr:DUF4232 domain-containing protein [Streptomyces sp. NRRL S-118]